MRAKGTPLLRFLAVAIVVACGAARTDPAAEPAIRITSPAPDAAVLGPAILFDDAWRLKY